MRRNNSGPNVILVLAILIVLSFSIATFGINKQRNEIEKLEEENKKYQSQINVLEHEKKILLTLKMPDALDQHYEKIRDVIVSKYSVKGDIGWNLISVLTVLHDLGEYTWLPQYNEFNETHNQTCNSYTGKFIRELSNLISTGVTKEEKIQQIYEWVDSRVTPVFDEWGYPRFPVETLVYGFGDCEDQAAALSCLLEYHGFETALMIIWDESLTNYTKEGLHHTFCLVEVNGFSYNGSTINLSNVNGEYTTWIILDPAFDQKFGGDPEWLRHYQNDNGEISFPSDIWNYIIVDYNVVQEKIKEIF